MGTSNWQNISYCIELIRLINPRQILDIGIGFGRWGILCREFLEVWNGRIFRPQWQINIEGVEAYPPYIDEYHKYFYNEIYLQEALGFVNQCNKHYDLIILGDVVEHFEKEQGMELLHKCREIGTYVLVNIPLGENWNQDAQYENEYEKHRSSWNQCDLDPFSIKEKRLFKDVIQRDFATYLLGAWVCSV